jgi:hypothetical protein
LTREEATLGMDDVLATVEVRRRRFTVEEYYRMAEVGILHEDDTEPQPDLCGSWTSRRT